MIAESTSSTPGNPPPKIRVVIADDHAVVREGMRQLLELDDSLEVVGTAANGAEAVRLVEELRPDVILMDVQMPVMDGVEATRRITASFPGTAVLVLSGFEDARYVQGLVEAGAAGYLLKDVRGNQLMEAIHSVHSGETVLHPTIARRVLNQLATSAHPGEHHHSEELSEREIEVLRMTAQGSGNEAIALAMGISVRTVQAHLSNIFDKMGVSSRTHAVVEALKRGWLRLEDLD